MSENPPRPPQKSQSTCNQNSPSLDLPPLHRQNSINSSQNHRQLPSLAVQRLEEMIRRNKYAAPINFGHAMQKLRQSGHDTPFFHAQSISPSNNMRARMLAQQSRQMASFDQEFQFNPSNSSDQGLKSLQPTGITNSFEVNQQNGANGQLPYGERMNNLLLSPQQPRQKASLDQKLQFNPSNSPDQGSKSSHPMGVINLFEVNQKTNANGQLPCGQPMNSQKWQRGQQMTMLDPLLSQLQSQPLQSGSWLPLIDRHFFGLTKSGATNPTAFHQQPLMKQMQPVSSPISSSSNGIQQPQLQRQQQQVFLRQQSSSPQILLQNLLGFTQQHQLLEHQGPLLGSQPPHQSSQCEEVQAMQIMQMLHQKKQQSARVQAFLEHQNNASLDVSRSATPVTVRKNQNRRGNSVQGANSRVQLLGKRKIQDLVSQVDPNGKLDPAVENLLLEIADDFIDSVTAFACNLAKHRKSSIVEPKDILLHLEKNLQLNIPGYTKDGQTCHDGHLSKNMHTEKLEPIRSSMESQQFERSSAMQTFPTYSALQQPLKPSPSLE